MMRPNASVEKVYLYPKLYGIEIAYKESSDVGRKKDVRI